MKGDITSHTKCPSRQGVKPRSTVRLLLLALSEAKSSVEKFDQ
jgi:hypothetical protein